MRLAVLRHTHTYISIYLCVHIYTCIHKKGTAVVRADTEIYNIYAIWFSGSKSWELLAQSAHPSIYTYRFRLNKESETSYVGVFFLYIYIYLNIYTRIHTYVHTYHDVMQRERTNLFTWAAVSKGSEIKSISNASQTPSLPRDIK